MVDYTVKSTVSKAASTSPTDSHWHVHDSLRAATKQLENKGIENPRQNAEQMLCLVLGISRVELYLNFERLLTTEEQAEFRAFVERRMADEPLQHILQKVEFMSLPFHVSPDVLIPRPETEVLVERVIEAWKNGAIADAPAILDIGTGSGCIAISLLSSIRAATCTAIDVSGKALELARRNALLNEVAERIEFINADVLQSHSLGSIGSTFDVVVSNPPYISATDFDNLPAEIRLFEPGMALTDSGDGLLFYRRIAELAPRFLKTCGFLLVEIGAGQEDVVTQLFEGAGLTKIIICRDLNDMPRVISVQLSNCYEHGGSNG